MNAIFTLLLVFLINPLLASAAPGPSSLCLVNRVYSGPNGTHIELAKCVGELGFTDKRIRLEHHDIQSKETRVGNTIYKDRIDMTLDVLAVKSTAELAMLFQRKVQVQMQKPNAEVISFISLDEPVDLTGNREWKPVQTRPAPNQ